MSARMFQHILPLAIHRDSVSSALDRRTILSSVRDRLTSSSDGLPPYPLAFLFLRSQRHQYQNAPSGLVAR